MSQAKAGYAAQRLMSEAENENTFRKYTLPWPGPGSCFRKFLCTLPISQRRFIQTSDKATASVETHLPGGSYTKAPWCLCWYFVQVLINVFTTTWMLWIISATVPLEPQRMSGTATEKWESPAASGIRLQWAYVTVDFSVAFLCKKELRSLGGTLHAQSVSLSYNTAICHIVSMNVSKWIPFVSLDFPAYVEEGF